MGLESDIQPNIEGPGLEYMKLCDTLLQAMGGILLRYVGQYSRTGDHSQGKI